MDCEAWNALRLQYIDGATRGGGEKVTKATIFIYLFMLSLGFCFKYFYLFSICFRKIWEQKFDVFIGFFFLEINNDESGNIFYILYKISLFPLKIKKLKYLFKKFYTIVMDIYIDF